MFGIGGFELFLILLFGFLIFGPDKLPEIAKTIGKAIAKFRGAQESMTEQLKDVAFVDKDSDTPLKNPLDVLNNVAKNAKEAKPGISSASKSEKLASEASASSGANVAEDANRSESFAERKARYDRERAKRKQAEAQAAKEAENKANEQAAKAKEAAENPKIDIASKSVTEEGE